MKELDGDGSADKGTEQTEMHVNQGRRDALMSFAKYTAPAMLAALISTTGGKAIAATSVPD